MNRLPVMMVITGTVFSGSTILGRSMMLGALTVVAGSSVLASSTALAADPAHSSWSAKRQFASQVINCMRQRMSNDKYISYNQAAKICKDEVRKQSTDAGPLVAADTKH